MDLLYDLGVRGYDCGPDEEDLDELAATKLKAVNFYYFPDWFGTDVHDWALGYTDRTSPAECIAKAKRHGIPRIMVVPPNFTGGKENETEFKVIVGKMRAFVAEAMAAARYDGWYTLENPVGDTYNDTVRQTALLKAWL